MITSSDALLMRDLAPQEQPREKLLRHGPRALTDAELVAILLRNGSRGRSVVDLARQVLLGVDHDLNELARRRISDLTTLTGLGRVKAMQLIAALELGRRREAAPPTRRPALHSSRDCFRVLRPLLEDLEYEEFHLLCLNRANELLGSHRISQGGTTGTVADAKRIFRTALTSHGAVTGLVLAHNHPSGQARPSAADLKLTAKLGRAARALDLQIMDHIIVAGRDYYSFADHQRLQSPE